MWRSQLLLISLLLTLPLAVPVAAQPAIISSCGGILSFSSLIITPATPVAGSPCNVTGVGTLSAAVQSSGPGEASAILYGATVFSAPVAACGPTNIDIMGLATLDIDGLSCPASAASPAAVSLALTIPSIASGMGQIGFIVNTSSTVGAAWCLNLTAFF